ncbi:alanine racemase, N-terminal domain protein [delta proteobacterium NaphS2]|nr:alanine racemase, N-terminal domain protein [delta proteobacterium NaphS2]
MPGQPLSISNEIPTPFILVDEGIVKSNLRRIHDYAHRHGFSVRAHVKTHKSLALARMQMAMGDVSIAVAKAEEAQVMVGLGHVDITVAYPAVGKARAEKIARLAGTHKIGVAVDSEYVMKGLEDAATAYGVEIGISVMLDAGLHRCGVSDPQALITLGEYARQSPSLRYEGVQMYVGHLYGEAADDPASFERINRIWDPAYESLCSVGLTPERVSLGSTPSLFNSHRIHHVNEIRVGTAVLNDYFVLKFGHCRLEDCAFRVVATVVSDRVPGQVLIDAGSKALSAKQLLRHQQLRMGYVVEYPHARIFRLHEEHGWVDVSRCTNPPKTGDRMSIIPVNAALCMNLHDHFHLLTETGNLHKERVDARGCQV